MILVGILVGAFIGGCVGFGIGVALGPGPETGAMYGINQLASGTVWGFWGLVLGATLGGLSGWVLKRRQGETLPPPPPLSRTRKTEPPAGD